MDVLCKNNIIINYLRNEWLLFNANSAIVLAMAWLEQVNFQWDDDNDDDDDDDDEVRFVLDQQRVEFL